MLCKSCRYPFCSCTVGLIFNLLLMNGCIYYSLFHTQGLLGCIFTMTERVHTCVLAILAVCGGFFVIIVQENKKHIPIALILMSGNILAMLISCFILSPLASYMKESESIEVAKKGTYIWLLLAMLIYYYDEFCIALRLVANIPAWLAWTLGIIGSFLMLLGGVWFICKKWPEVWWIQLIIAEYLSLYEKNKLVKRDVLSVL